MPKTTLIQRMEKAKAPKAWIREVKTKDNRIERLFELLEEYLNAIDLLAREKEQLTRTIDSQQVWVEKYKAENEALREGIHAILQQLQLPRTDTLPLRETLDALLIGEYDAA